jgi:hypothetical protein
VCGTAVLGTNISIRVIPNQAAYSLQAYKLKQGETPHHTPHTVYWYIYILYIYLFMYIILDR